MNWLLPLTVALLTFAAFAPALRAQFVNFDDDVVFTSNPYLAQPWSVQLPWMFTTRYQHYQPLTWISSAIDYRILGLNPAIYHFNNNLIHALNGLLLYFVSLRLIGAALRVGLSTEIRVAAAVSALVWAVHPLRVESVAWATERRDVLSVFFMLLALLGYLRWVQPPLVAQRSRLWSSASLILLAASLLSKVWAVSFFVWLLILDVYPLRRLPARPSGWWAHRAVLLEKLPYAALGVAAAVVERWALETDMAPLEEWSVADRVVQAFYGLFFYLRKTMWPTSLVAIYERPESLHVLELRYWGSALAVCAIAGAIVLLRRRLPSLSAAAVFYGVSIAPVLGFAQSGPHLVADRLSYVSCIGWSLLAGGGLLALWRRHAGTLGRAALTGGVGLTILLLAVVTRQQSRVWIDSERLWVHALARGEASAVAHLNYAGVLMEQGRVPEAIQHYGQALQIGPRSSYAGKAWFGLGVALATHGNNGEAEDAFGRATTYPLFAADARIALGNFYALVGRSKDAVREYRRAVAFVESSPPALFTRAPYVALSRALEERGRTEEARQIFQEGIARARRAR